MKASVIIPTFNAEKTIQGCLNALGTQSVAKKDFEIIVVNDGSADKTALIVSKFKQVRLISQSNRGPASARNNGAKHAVGDILVFLDSDCIPKSNWLKEMIVPFANSKIVGVQGRYENPLKEWMACFIQLEIEERYERMQKNMQKNGSIDFIGSYSAAYRRTIFLQEGGFDEGFSMASGEDPDLSYRLAKKNYKLVFAPKAIVKHFHPTSIFKYWRTKFYRAYWRVRLYQRHPAKMKGDSYTNQQIKWQMGFMVFAGFFLILSVIANSFFPNTHSNWTSPAFLIAGGITVLLTFPTAFFMIKKDWRVGLIAPIILTINIFFFVGGYLCGNLKLHKRGSA